MNSIGIGGSASTGALSEEELDAVGAEAEVVASDSGFDESLHPNRKKRARRAKSLADWIKDMDP
ncbi:MAG: hypothetical protein MKZ70_02445 [Opitutales bacterium]|nr:hypothetical protein [Opitutales bacterium]